MHNKYQKLIKQVSDDGINWVNAYPLEYRQGALLEENSVVCGGGQGTETRWVEVYGEYLCRFGDKYQKLKLQEYNEQMMMWQDVMPLQTKEGELIEKDSPHCGYGEVWIDTDRFECAETEDPPTPPTPETYYRIITTINGGGTLYVVPSQYSYLSGTSVYIGAKPLSNYTFDHYEYGSTSLYGSTTSESNISLIMDNNWFVKAIFNEKIVGTELNYLYSDGTISQYYHPSTYLDSTYGGGSAVTIIDVGGGIEDIQFNLFMSARYLSYVAFPNLITLGAAAFEGCVKLESVQTPKITKVPHRGFYSCAIKYADFPIASAVDTYGFCGCIDLISVNMSNLQFISSHGFAYCTSLMSLDLPNLIFADENAFQSCYSLSYFNAPQLRSLGYRMFSSCTNLTSISIPMVTSIGNGVFYDCWNLESVTFNNVTYIGYSAFQYCSKLSNADCPNLTELHDSAFERCSGLEYVNMPQIKSLPQFAFLGCSALSELHIPQANLILSRAFAGCVNLTNVYLNEVERVTSIADSYVFYNCSKLTSIYVPSSLLNGFKNHNVWSRFSSKIVGV